MQPLNTHTIMPIDDNTSNPSVSEDNQPRWPKIIWYGISLIAIALVVVLVMIFTTGGPGHQ